MLRDVTQAVTQDVTKSLFGDTGFTSTDVPQAEADALIAFYDATDGDSWTDNTGWGTDTTVGDWYGVTVSGGHVTALNLNGNTLNGEGLQCLSPLSELTSLYLQNNGDLTGDVDSLNNLTSLEKFYCHTTGLYGNFNNYSAGAMTLVIMYQTNISGDLNQFAVFSGLTGVNSWQGLSVYGTNIEQYTTTPLPAWGCFLEVRGIVLSQTSVNSFLEDLDDAGGIGGVLNISGVNNAAPSWGTEGSPSDTALAVVSLLEKDWTLTVTGSVPQWVLDLVEWTCTAGDLKLATKDGEAMMFDINDEDFSGLAAEGDGTSNYLLEFVDDADKTARAYAYTVGGGEALGNELVTNGDLATGDTTGWTAYSDAILSIVSQQLQTQLTGGDTFGSAGQQLAISQGQLCFFTRDNISKSSSFGSRVDATASGFEPVSSTYTSIGTKSEYFTVNSLSAYVQLYTSGENSNAIFDNISVKALTDIPATGLHLVSTQDGTTRNMASVETGFNPNAIVKVRFLDPSL